MKHTYKIFALSILITLAVVFISFDFSKTEIKPIVLPTVEIVGEQGLLYDDVWGSIYHAVKSQCDDTPLITGSRFRIDPKRASEQRILAISQEMLDSPYRVGLLNDPESELYKGKIQYGDSVWVESPHEEINGWWVVHDVKNPRYRLSVDFLQTKGDGSLYNNDPLWNGRFEDIKIYKHKPI